jgi:hypothetical protein
VSEWGQPHAGGYEEGASEHDRYCELIAPRQRAVAIADRPRDETFLEFGETEWCAHKRAVSEMKAQEYLENLHIIAETKIHIGAKKPRLSR